MDARPEQSFRLNELDRLEILSASSLRPLPGREAGSAVASLKLASLRPCCRPIRGVRWHRAQTPYFGSRCSTEWAQQAWDPHILGHLEILGEPSRGAHAVRIAAAIAIVRNGPLAVSLSG